MKPKKVMPIDEHKNYMDFLESCGSGYFCEIEHLKKVLSDDPWVKFAFEELYKNCREIRGHKD